MLYPTNGARLYIADAPADQAGAFPASGWVEIGETEALGMLGGEWDVQSATIANCEESAEVHFAKEAFRRTQMQIVLGDDPTDPGQAILWGALRSEEHFPFRLEFPDGITARHWRALVVSLSEVFDAANSVIKIQASLQPTSPMLRSEAP